MAVLLCVAAASQLLAQNHPLPAKAGSAVVRCASCPGRNAQGQNNDGSDAIPVVNGLPTFQYSAPIVRHVGRLVDSSNTVDVQNIGFRTARAGAIKTAKTQRGAAPPRVYVQIGGAVGAYSLDAFFSRRLPGGMSTVNNIQTMPGKAGGRTPLEKITLFDAFIYPENSNSGWTYTLPDIQTTLFSFDFDDRGYIYPATAFGWAIVPDDGRTSGAHLPAPKKQIQTSDTRTGVWTIMAFNSGAKYYVALSGQNADSMELWDVTEPTTPTSIDFRDGTDFGFKQIAHTSGYVALLNGDNQVRIYTAAGYASGAAPIRILPGSYADICADDSGNFWAAETTTRRIQRVTPSPAGGTLDSFSNLYGGQFDAIKMHAAGGYVAVGGYSYDGGTRALDLRLMKLDGSTLTNLDLGGFFRKYYHSAPSGYAQPPYTPGHYVYIMKGVQIVPYGGKTYLMYDVHGMGDVYEIQAGNAIAASMDTTPPFGTRNTNSAAIDEGPYPGDVLTFTATNTSGSSVLNVNWDFANTEAGGLADQRSGTTGQDVPYQYSGLSTSTAITNPKTVTVATTDGTLTDSLPVVLKVPTARVNIPGSGVVSSSATVEDIVAGDVLKDASDGTIESHYASWNVDGTTTKLKPNQTQSIDTFGPHTVAFSTSYSQYDANFNSVGTPYVKSITLNFKARPFVVNLNNPTATSSQVTFSGVGRKTTVPNTFLGSNWTVTWTLKNAAGTTDLAPPQTSTVATGTIPNYVVDRASVVSGSKVRVTVDMNASDLSSAAQNYNSAYDEMVLTTPDPQIAKNGCANVGDPCSFTGSSASSASTSNWTWSWSITLSGTVKRTGSGSTITFDPAVDGNYIASLTATQGIFSNTVTQSFSVAPTTCGNPPDVSQLSIDAECATCVYNPSNNTVTADSGSSIHFYAGAFQYNPQACDSVSWNFGDGQTGSGMDVIHPYSSNGSYTVRLTWRTTTSTSTTVTVKIGSGTPPPTCNAPSTLTLAYGCTTCKEDTSITMLRTENGGSFQTCDTVSMDFGDGKSPSTSKSGSVSHTYSDPGTYTVTLTSTNTNGTKTITKPIVIIQNSGGGSCPLPPAESDFAISYTGPASGCSQSNPSSECRHDEAIQFQAQAYPYAIQSCDQFLWDFGDGSPTSSDQNPSHTFTGSNTYYTVNLKVWNTNLPNGFTIPITVKFTGAVTLPIPQLTATTFPSSSSRGQTVSFTATSNMDETTGWTWTFGDGSTADTSQSGLTMRVSTISHTFTKTGTFTVRVRARNANDVPSAPTNEARGDIAIADAPPVHRYLLPVVTHGAGQNGSVWRTDVQIYNSDPNVQGNPLSITASFNGVQTQLSMTGATKIYDDFMLQLNPTCNTSTPTGPCAGSVIITSNSSIAPQIWTRTYNYDPAAGKTFGQFIPAISLDGTSSAASPDAPIYYLAGLRLDDRYRTNMGLVNPNLDGVTVTVRVYDYQGIPLLSQPFTKDVGSFQLSQFSVCRSGCAAAGGLEVPNLPANKPFAVDISVPAGKWLVAYASLIDGSSNDPIYIQGVDRAALASNDYRSLVIPGVGRVGAWHSDVSIFNPDSRPVSFDLEYYDQTGARAGLTPGVPLGAGQVLQLNSILDGGIFSPAPTDGLGVLRINVVSPDTTRYPVAFSRTYYDNGADGTYGQGIDAFPAARANVKPGTDALIPGVRSDASYYTNIGLTNLSDQQVSVQVEILDPTTGLAVGPLTSGYVLQPHQSTVGRFTFSKVLSDGTVIAQVNSGSLRVRITNGNGPVWAFASIVDVNSHDPEYVPAMPLQ